jgi:putative transcriptional regulator
LDKLNVKIAGEIALSDKPGGTMKKWREIFGITQAELGHHMKISASTVSDYEGNRRKSPGIVVVKRFVDALIEIDMSDGGAVTKRLREEDKGSQFFETTEFSQSVSGMDFAKIVDAKVVANGELLEERKLYGFTLLDSIKVILEMPYNDFPRLYGSSPERAFVFSEVSTGRSPLVVVRVSQVKPSVIVLHGIDKVDKLAVKIAQVEKIPLLVTKIGMEELKARLNRI